MLGVVLLALLLPAAAEPRCSEGAQNLTLRNGVQLPAAGFGTAGLGGAVVAALRLAGMRYIVAPYEADPQLRMLDKMNIVDYVLTVDSDLVALGVRRTLVMSKFADGQARLYSHDAIFHPEDPHEPGSLLATFAEAGPEALLFFALCAGCDYSKFAGVAAGKAESREKSGATRRMHLLLRC